MFVTADLISKSELFPIPKCACTENVSFSSLPRYLHIFLSFSLSLAFPLFFRVHTKCSLIFSSINSKSYYILTGWKTKWKCLFKYRTVVFTSTSLNLKYFPIVCYLFNLFAKKQPNLKQLTAGAQRRKGQPTSTMNVQ